MLFATNDGVYYSSCGANLAVFQLAKLIGVLLARFRHYVVEDLQLALREHDVQELAYANHHDQLQSSSA
jgi:hypothetical protein